MKKLILATLFCIASIMAKAQATSDIMLYTYFEWTTNNGITWAKDIFPLPSDPDLDDEIGVPVGSLGKTCFFVAKAVDNGNLDVWHSFVVTTYSGTNATLINTPISTNTFYVYPNPVDGYGTNIQYRVIQTIPQVYHAPGTNVCQSCDTNSTPPSP